MIDVNRAEDDIDPAIIDGVWPLPLAPAGMTLMGFGLVRRICKSGVALYKGPLARDEIVRRIKTYYRPYHDALQLHIGLCKQEFGICYLIDAHSMPDRVDNGMRRPDFILGDRDGTTCSRALTDFVQKQLEGLGYKVAVNDPYKGREIVARYGLAGEGAQALQIEVNRKLYIEEATLEKHSGFDKLRLQLTDLFIALSSFIRAEMADRIAAE
jgi:N-formylglutamate amidohydrolase